MKRIIFLAIGFIFVMQLAAFAEVKTDTNEYGTTMSSDYSINVKNSDYKCTLWCSAIAQRVFGTMGSMEDRLIMLYSEPFENSTPVQLINFSKKNPPKFQIVKNNQITTVPIGKIKGIGTNNLQFMLKEDALKVLNEADEVSLVIPKDTRNELKIIIPKDIIGEWETVLNADLKKVRREVVNG